MGLSFKTVITEAITFRTWSEHAVDNVQLIQQDSVSFFGTVGRVAFAFGLGVGLKGLFELVGNADVIDNKTARLVFEDAVYPGDRLHQVVAPHGFVHIHGVAAGCVEAG